MNVRIKKLRKTLDLTQAEFAKRIGTTANVLTHYETGRRNPSSSVINNICKTFNVSEVWLRAGEGEMFVELPRNEALAAQIQAFLQGGTDSFRERLVSLLIRLEPEQWDALESYLVELVKERPASAVAPTPAPPTGTDIPDPATAQDLAAELAEVKRQNQELTAKVAAMEEEDALLGLTDVSSASPSVSVGIISPAQKTKI